RLHRRRCSVVPGGLNGSPGPRWPAGGVPASRFLAMHGHDARRSVVARDVGVGSSGLEGVDVTMADFWRSRRVLVTGATGLLGGWLVRRLVGAGADVVCLVRDWVPSAEVLQPVWLARVTVVRGDVRRQAMLERVLGEYEVGAVFHLAAQTIVGIANRN